MSTGMVPAVHRLGCRCARRNAGRGRKTARREAGGGSSSTSWTASLLKFITCSPSTRFWHRPPAGTHGRLLQRGRMAGRLGPHGPRAENLGQRGVRVRTVVQAKARQLRVRTDGDASNNQANDHYIGGAEVSRHV